MRSEKLIPIRRIKRPGAFCVGHKAPAAQLNTQARDTSVPKNSTANELKGNRNDCFTRKDRGRECDHRPVAKIEDRINTPDGIVARWEFGRLLLQQKVDRQLPKGLRAEIAAEFKLESSEITRRMQLAQKFSSTGLSPLATAPSTRRCTGPRSCVPTACMRRLHFPRAWFSTRCGIRTPA
jgi:hypothetical protein